MKNTLSGIILSALVTFSALGEEPNKPADSASKTSTTNAKAEGEAFLAKNAKVDGIKVLPDGLQYRVIKEGTGAVPTTNDLVFIKFRGKHLEGGEFDHNNHFLTRTTGGIQGWQDALQRMRVGSKWQIFVPPQLAFGEEGDPYLHIPPNATLTYDIEMLSIPKEGDPQIGTGALGHGLSGQDNPGLAHFKPGVVGSETGETNTTANATPNPGAVK